MSFRAPAAALAGLLMLALAGCATASPGAAPSSAPESGIGIEAAWLDGGRMIALVTPVPVCAPLVSEVEVDEDGTLQVILEDAEGASCAEDSVQQAVGVSLPDGVDPAQALAVRVTYGVDSRGETTLDGYTGAAATDFAPSAGWVRDGLLAILTWGSSTCGPAVESATASAADAVTVTFAAPPADRMCTMDMAPRVTLAEVDGAAGGAPVTLTLTGGSEFPEPVTVPVAA